MNLRITAIDCHVLVQPSFDTTAASSAQDDIVVEIHTDEGITGIGETDLNPWIARACIEAPGTHNMGLGLSEILIGSDPLDVEGLWQRLYVGSAMNGRRGAVINAIGALDIALHDLRGKALGKPCYELLGVERYETASRRTRRCSPRPPHSRSTSNRWWNGRSGPSPPASARSRPR